MSYPNANITEPSQSRFMVYQNTAQTRISTNMLAPRRHITAMVITPEDRVTFPALRRVQANDVSFDLTASPFDPSTFDSSYDFDASDEYQCSPLTNITDPFRRVLRAFQGNPVRRTRDYFDDLALQNIHRQRAEEDNRTLRERAAAVLRRREGVVRRAGWDEGDPPPPSYQLIAGDDERVLEVWNGAERTLGILLPPPYEHPPVYERLSVIEERLSDEEMPTSEEPLGMGEMPYDNGTREQDVTVRQRNVSLLREGARKREYEEAQGRRAREGKTRQTYGHWIHMQTGIHET
jgi:hypothetical protein